MYEAIPNGRLAIIPGASHALVKEKPKMMQAVIKDFYKGFIPVVFPVIVICVLILPANLSTALMLGFTCCILFYIGRVNVKHILILAVSGIALIGLMILFNIGPRAATWKNRILTYVSAEKKVAASDDDKEDEFQATQAKIAIANGGLNGLGPGKSMQRNFLPHPYSDFIYAIIIEEYGLLGGAVLMFVYMLFLWRCIRIFQRCPYAYGAFLAVGLSITLVFQAMLNMGVNVSLLPVTGLTLPMVSMGGSSIWFTSIAIGISQRQDELINRDTFGLQTLRAHNHLVLANLAAKRRYICYPRGLLELFIDLIVL